MVRMSYPSWTGPALGRACHEAGDVDTDVTQVSERSAAHDRFENGTVHSGLRPRPHARRSPQAPPTDHRGDPGDERA